MTRPTAPTVAPVAAAGHGDGGMVDHCPDALIRVDAGGRIVDANPAAVALTGYEPGALIGASCPGLLDPRTPLGEPLLGGGFHRSARLRSVTGVPEQHVRITRADGNELLVHVTASYQRDVTGTLEGATLALRRGGSIVAQQPERHRDRVARSRTSCAHRSRR